MLSKNLLRLIAFLSILLVLVSVPFAPAHHPASAASTVIVPSMRLPWDKSLTTVTYNSGPHGNYSTNSTCQVEPLNKMSGLDFGMPENTPVLAVAGGIVRYAQYYDGQLRNVVIIDHGGNFNTQYWHLNSIDPSITLGSQVLQGQVIGASGWSPCSSCQNGKAIHLHLEFSSGSDYSTPYTLTPYKAHGIGIDGYKAWSIVPSSGQGYNYQGTMTRGTVTQVTTTYGTVTGDTSATCAGVTVKEWTGAISTRIALGGLGCPNSCPLTSTNHTKNWNIVSSPSVSGVYTFLSAVSAISSSNVWAVGYSFATSSNPVAMQWNGKSWKSKNPTGAPPNSLLFGVKALSSTDIWAVGYTNSQTLVLHSDGTSWTAVASDKPGVSSYFVAIAGVASNDMWAVGLTQDASPPHATRTLIEHCLGAIQGCTVVPSPNLDTTDDELLAVTAISSDDVWAVGRSYVNGTPQPLILHWDSSHVWNIIQAPSDPNINGAIIYGISAISSTDVWAVGYKYSNTADMTLTMHWDGTMWTIFPSPSLANTDVNKLYAVSATSNGVLAVGAARTLPPNQYDQTLIMRWDGFQWVVMNSPNKPSSTSNSLEGVAMISNEAWAVGCYVPVTVTNGYCSTLTEQLS